jgi:hypothetical protein
VPGLRCKCGGNGGKRNFRQWVARLPRQQTFQKENNKQKENQMKLAELKTSREVAPETEWMEWTRRHHQYSA